MKFALLIKDNANMTGIPANTVTFIEIEQLKTLIQLAIRQELRSKEKDDLQDKFLSPAETCKLFSPPISKVTLTSWTRKGLLINHPISGRVYYKYSEVMAAGKQLTKYKHAVF